MCLPSAAPHQFTPTSTSAPAPAYTPTHTHIPAPNPNPNPSSNPGPSVAAGPRYRDNPEQQSRTAPSAPLQDVEAMNKFTELGINKTAIQGLMQNTRLQEYIGVGAILLVFLCFVVAVLIESYF